MAGPPQTETENRGTATARERWSARGIGASWQHRFFYALIRLGGKRAAYHVMYVVVFWYVLFYRGIRRRTRHYLDRRFPEHRHAWHRFWDSYHLVRVFGQTLIDQAAGGILGPGSLRATCPDADALAAVVRGSRGVVLVNAHVGCWQVAMSILTRLEKPVSVVMLPEQYQEQWRATGRQEPPPFQVIDPRQGLVSVVQMTQALERGEIVGLMGDRVFGSDTNTVAAEFLGARAEFPLSPYRLAGAAGAPIVVLLSHKTGLDTYEIRLARVIRVPAGLGRDAAAYAPWARQLAEVIEGFVREHPWQFFNFYDLWAHGPQAG